MGEKSVNSEVAGTVWKIEKGIGDAVMEEDVIMILESMKMEIPVLAPCSGKLAALHVDEGAIVAEGHRVATIET